jgi:hypothetical protein
LQHQPAKRKRIIFRVLYRFEVARMVDEPSQNFERHALYAMLVLCAHPARAHRVAVIPLPE